jgi:hypothetical protein
MSTTNGAPARIRLLRRGDAILCDAGDGREPRPVKLVWARPVADRGGPLSVLAADRHEVALLGGLDELDPESRQIAEQELAARYLVPRITRVIKTRAVFGMRYLHVETDRGERRLAFKDATRDAVWITDDHVMLRDTMGCRYEIRPFSGLDPVSLREARRVL